MIQGHFVPSQAGNVFITQYSASSQPSAKTVLLLPSIFEEMNLCRAVLAKQAQFLNQHGVDVYCLDYFGCGDSQGEIIDANAEIWQQNIVDTVGWLKQNGVSSLSLWGMRFGALLGTQSLIAIQQILPVEQMIWWKPVVKGQQFMTQFLRLKQASSMMQGEQKIKWREHILEGNVTEVAGYEISANLLSSIDKLLIPAQRPDKVLPILDVSWFELSANKVTPVIQKIVDGWEGSQISVNCFEGSAFWQIPEIFEQGFLHETMLNTLCDNPHQTEPQQELS